MSTVKHKNEILVYKGFNFMPIGTPNNHAFIGSLIHYKMGIYFVIYLVAQGSTKYLKKENMGCLTFLGK